MVFLMNFTAIAILCLACLATQASAAIKPSAVVVLYNSALPESRKLAEDYRMARGIPAVNLVGLEMPMSADISREQYNSSIVAPLRGEFDKRKWWLRQKDPSGIIIPTNNQIQVLVLMRGVPLRIQATPKPAPAPNSPPPPPPPPGIEGHDEASVDSELAMMGVEGLPTDGVLQNKFHKSPKGFSEAKLPFLILTARIDAPSKLRCELMIRDAVETEQTGLWGRAYVDIANKIPQGDQWLENVAKANFANGISTMVDRFNDTLPKNYPMTDAALYYGWYDAHVSGPFLNPRFQFRKGAVALHLHSFSAEQLTDPQKNWSGALLERGAAVTIGNVYEPYLHLTHDFGILHENLLAGFTWVEACWMAMPVTSWQGVVLGDPLYTPFAHFDNTGQRVATDKEFRALRAASIEWKTNPAERIQQLEKAAERMSSGILAEALGAEFTEKKDHLTAGRWFRSAKNYYIREDDKLRQDLLCIANDRTANKKDLAIKGLLDAQIRFANLSEADAIKGWLDILAPPPPPPAQVPPLAKP
jgi:uncharacterized protein (TIGR03790 family)